MSDAQIWQRLRSGDHDALKEIYQSQIDFLLAYGIRFARDTSEVEDGIHDLFVHLWQKRETIGSTDKIRPYLATALRRRLLKSLKKNNYEQVIPGIFNAEPSIEEDLITSEIESQKLKKLRQALSGLSDREKEGLLLKYQHNLDYGDIAKIMEIKYQSVRNLVSRAIKKLRKTLEFLTGLIFFIFQ